MTRLFVLIHPHVYLPHLHQPLKRPPLFFHLSRITLCVSSFSLGRVQAGLTSTITRASVEVFLVMLEPVAILETFFGLVARRNKMIGLDEALHFPVFL